MLILIKLPVDKRRLINETTFLARLLEILVGFEEGCKLIYCFSSTLLSFQL